MELQSVSQITNEGTGNVWTTFTFRYGLEQYDYELSISNATYSDDRGSITRHWATVCLPDIEEASLRRLRDFSHAVQYLAVLGDEWERGIPYRLIGMAHVHGVTIE